ncbi:hypothetical protein [Bosea sp. (in: a-proteobacteria)]|uniref:hypothetical protein n=1 Tax=Bosea sp. (in: a-proteobacteria) TaxID=1871050 RepID=UPI002FC5F192
MFETLTLGPDDNDATLASRLRKALRSAGDAPLLIAGDFARSFDDADAAFAWLGLLTTSQCLLALQAEGLLGQRGIALMLACDLAFVGPTAALDDAWRETPGLAALALRRSGSALARPLLLGGIETVDDMAEAGLVLPLAALEEIADKLDDSHLAALRRRKRALRAAEALPFDEALRFDLAFLGKEAFA